jgi:hypothetical protein
LKEELGLDHFESQSWPTASSCDHNDMIGYAYGVAGSRRRGAKKNQWAAPQPTLPAIYQVTFEPSLGHHYPDARTAEMGV